MQDAGTVEKLLDDLALGHRRPSAKQALLARRDAREAFVLGTVHEDAIVRAVCTRALDRLGDDSTFPLFVELLDDPAAEVRRDAIHALACDRCKQEGVCLPAADLVLDQAIRLLDSDESRHVRAIAAEVVGLYVHDDKRAVAALERACATDPAPMVRKKVAWYLPGGPIHRRTAPRRQRISAS